MLKYTIQVDGMMCGMCEAHVNAAVRQNFDSVKKVTSSHSKNETVILSEQELDENALRKVITDLGYDAGEIRREPYEKRSLFGQH